MKPLLALFFLCAFSCTCVAQNVQHIDRDDLLTLEKTIGVTDLELEFLMGTPDKYHEDWGETVWVYYGSVGSSNEITEYTIFVFSDSKVSWCSKHWHINASDADEIYKAIVSFMGEDERTLIKSSDTEAFRLANKGGNFWMTDVDHSTPRSQVELFLGRRDAQHKKQPILIKESERLAKNLE